MAKKGNCWKCPPNDSKAILKRKQELLAEMMDEKGDLYPWRHPKVAFGFSTDISDIQIGIQSRFGDSTVSEGSVMDVYAKVQKLINVVGRAQDPSESFMTSNTIITEAMNKVTQTLNSFYKKSDPGWKYFPHTIQAFTQLGLDFYDFVRLS